MRPPSRAARRVTRLFFGLAFVPIFLVFPYLRGINNPNEFVRVFTTMALVEEHTFAIDNEVATFGWVNDMVRVKRDDGLFHYYSVKAPGSVYASLPGYWLFRGAAHLLGHRFPNEKSNNEDRLWWLRWSTWACRASSVQLPCFVFLVWFERFLRTYSGDLTLRLSAVAAAGLGTNYLAYMHLFASHAPSAVCAFASFAMMVDEVRRTRGDSRRRRASRAFLCAWFASACVVLEYHLLFVAALLCLFGLVIFWRPTRALAFLAGGSANVPLVMWFQWRAFGNPLTPGHKMLETPSFAERHHMGLFGVVWPSWEHLKPLAIDAGYGLFGTSPYMVLGVLAIPFVLLWPRDPSRAMRRALRFATVVWLLSMALLLLVNAGIIEYHGGWAIGPRYQAAAPPFYAFGAVTALESLSRRSRLHRSVSRGLSGGLALASVLTIGVVGIILDTLPESVDRPLVQIALPLIRTGFVPHHLFEWVGWTGTTPWYLALACLLGAVLLTVVYINRDRLGRYALRIAVAGLFLYLGLIPAFTPPEGAEKIAVGGEAPWFMSMWEPQGRDRLSALREEAERYGPRRPCVWYKLADLERAANLTQDAERDERRARGAPKDKCAPVYF